MNKQDIELILLANLHFTKCKLENPLGSNTELAREYLFTKINETLSKKTKSKSVKNLLLT